MKFAIPMLCVLAATALAQADPASNVSAGLPLVDSSDPADLQAVDPSTTVTFDQFQAATVRVPRIIDMDDHTTIYAEVPAKDIKGAYFFQQNFWDRDRPMKVGDMESVIANAPNNAVGPKKIRMFDRAAGAWTGEFDIDKFSAIDGDRKGLVDRVSSYFGIGRLIGSSDTFYVLRPPMVDVQIETTPTAAVIWSHDAQTNRYVQEPLKPTTRHVQAARGWERSLVLKKSGYRDCTAPNVQETTADHFLVSCVLAPQ